MKRLLALALISSVACNRYVVRDAKVYRTEMSFFEMALHKSSSLLYTHLREHCSCDARGRWSSSQCEETAKTIAVLDARTGYHIQMMLHNAGLQEDAPNAIPEIPDPRSLCAPQTGAKV